MGAARRNVPPAAGLDERSLSLLVRHAHNAFVRVLAAQLAPHGVSVGEWAVLRALWRGDVLSQVELAARMGVQKASLTAVLDGLERKGCIVRERSQVDRRKSCLRATPRAFGLERQLRHYGEANNERALRGVSARDAETARRVMERVIANLTVG
jgi:DNA-binding MarR family transcriptional regulator